MTLLAWRASLVMMKTIVRAAGAEEDEDDKLLAML